MIEISKALMIELVSAGAILLGMFYAVCAERAARRRDEAFDRKYRTSSVFGGGRVR